MAAYRRVYDSRHLQADCQEPGSAPEPFRLPFTFYIIALFYIIVILLPSLITILGQCMEIDCLYLLY